MIVNCEWCGIEFDNDRIGVSLKGDNHRIVCLSCASSEMMKTPIKMRNFLDNIGMPVVLVDESGMVQVANIHTSFLLQKSLASIEGNAGGDVFECAYSTLPERCGNTIHCSGCTIRCAIMETHATGKPKMKIPAKLTLASDSELKDVHFYISTEKLDKYVVLSINA